MKRLLPLACGIASAICLSLLAAQAGATPTAPFQPEQPLQYSRPAADGLLVQGVPPVISGQCQQKCAEANTNCMQNPPKSGRSCPERNRECVNSCP